MFVPVKRDVADVEPTEYLSGASGLSIGEAAVLTSGALAACGATTKPTHIVSGEAKDLVYPCFRVHPTTQFEVPCTAAIASAGGVVTLHTDSLQVTATATSGVFTVDYTANAANSLVRGHFA